MELSYSSPRDRSLETYERELQESRVCKGKVPIGILTPTNSPCCSAGPTESIVLPRAMPTPIAMSIHRTRKRSRKESPFNGGRSGGVSCWSACRFSCCLSKVFGRTYWLEQFQHLSCFLLRDHSCFCDLVSRRSWRRALWYSYRRILVLMAHCAGFWFVLYFAHRSFVANHSGVVTYPHHQEH